MVLGASLSRNKSLSIPEDLVNEETINGEVIVRGGPMSGSYSTSTDAENSFILNSHILAKLRKELKNKMNFKTDSNFKKSTPSEIRKHEDQIATLIGSLNNYSNPFHEVAWQQTTGAEIPGNIINGLPSGGKKICHRKSRAVYKKEIAIPRSKFLWSHTTHYYSNVIEKKETKKGNICPQGTALDCWIICEKIAWKTRGLQLSYKNRPTNSLHAWRGIVSTKHQVTF